MVTALFGRGSQYSMKVTVNILTAVAKSEQSLVRRRLAIMFFRPNELIDNRTSSNLFLYET